MGRSNLKASLDLDNKVFFIYPQADGTVILSIEEYDESSTAKGSRPN